MQTGMVGAVYSQTQILQQEVRCCSQALLSTLVDELAGVLS